MSLKALQIALVIVAVVCALGLASLLVGRDVSMPDDFRPPHWIAALEGLAVRPTVSRTDLRQARRSFPRELRMDRRDEKRYSVQPDLNHRVRQLDFDVEGRGVVIRYQNPEEEQRWPNPRYPDEEPSFIIYESGGTLIFTTGLEDALIRVKE